MLVQIYTGFIYTGPELIADCVEAIRAARPAHAQLVAPRASARAA